MKKIHYYCELFTSLRRHEVRQLQVRLRRVEGVDPLPEARLEVLGRRLIVDAHQVTGVIKIEPCASRNFTHIMWIRKRLCKLEALVNAGHSHLGTI